MFKKSEANIFFASPDASNHGLSMNVRLFSNRMFLKTKKINEIKKPETSTSIIEEV